MRKRLLEHEPLIDAQAMTELEAFIGRLAAGDVTAPPPDLRETAAAPLAGDLERVRAALAAATDAAKRAADLERLLHDLAHELRTPLGILDGTLEMVASDYGNLSTRELDRLLASARAAAARMRVLLENLLSAGAIQAGGFRPTLQAADLGELVRAATATVTPTVAARGQRLEQDLACSATVRADPFWISLALTNLVTNASKYSPAGSTIRVRAQPRGDVVVVSVADQGPGIPIEDQPGVFDRYYRSAKTGGHPGIGLGLAIVKGIVEAHGGSIGIESGPQAGATVWFTLPRIPQADAP